MTKIKENNIIVKVLPIILIAIFCVSLTPVTFQNDTYYTIKIGEYILENGIDMQDPFSWHEDLPYTYPHWLYDLITYLIYSFSGFTGIYIATCILSVILGITIYFVNNRLSNNKIISLFITIGVMYLLRGYIAARAQLVTFILFILTIYFIEMFLKEKKKRYVVPLILIPILIANLHAAVWPFYFILYLPYIGEYLISILSELIFYKKIKKYRLQRKIYKLNKKNRKDKLEIAQREFEDLNIKIEKIKLKREEEKNNRYKIEIVKNNNVKYLIIIMILCLLTGFLTPIGDTPFTYLIKTLQGNTTKNINEHLPMTLINNTDILCTLIIFISILTFTKSKIRLNDLFMLGGLGYLMLSSQRQSSMFALIGGIILNKLIININCFSGKNKLKEYKNMNKYIFIIASLVIICLSIYNGVPKLKDSFVNEQEYPVQASEWILKNMNLDELRMYNEYNFGSYLLFKGIPVFIDSRADLYSPEFNTKTGNKDDGKIIFSDFIDTSNISKFYGKLVEEYNMTHIMVYKNSKINMLIENIGGGDFVLIYSDKQFVIYEIVK